MPGFYMEEVIEIGNLIRKKVHDLNNLIMVIEGNIKMMRSQDEELLCDNLESLKECKEIVKSLLMDGRKLSRIGSN